MAKSFTIEIHVPDGDPDGIRIANRFGSELKALAFPRSELAKVAKRDLMDGVGVYILVGQGETDPPKLYIGQADGVGERIEGHDASKGFWTWGIAFVSSGRALNRAHVTWLEHALIERAKRLKSCQLENASAPREPTLSEVDKANAEGLLEQILQMAPLLGIRAFEESRPVVIKKEPLPPLPPVDELDTIVVPARKDGFDEVFIGQDCWYAVRISDARLPKIRYIAAYQTAPVSAVTHYAEVARIEVYDKVTGKYKLVFKGRATPLRAPIPLGKAKPGSMQGTRYTTFGKLRSAKQLIDL